MQLEQAIRQRRSIRRFKETKFPDPFIEKALELATLAPNSSNTQTWDFFWVKSPDKKKDLITACLGQSAARTASDLIVATSNPKSWRRSQAPLIEWVKKSKAPSQVELYYKKLIPLTYSWGLFNSFALIKWIGIFFAGFFRAVPRGPNTKRDSQEVAIKSSALACENFVLSITADGGATCMMEGFDEVRVKKLLGLARSCRVTMVIAVGYAAENGTWGPQFRLPLEQVIHQV